MSYDILVNSPNPLTDEQWAEAKKRVSNLKSAEAMEIHFWDDDHHQREEFTVLSTSLYGDDEEVSAFWKSLAKLCSAGGWTLFDPQAGASADLEDAGNYPLMWRPTSTIGGKTLNTKIKNFARDVLRAHGFHYRSDGDIFIEQVQGPLTQGFIFEKGGRSNSGKFTINLFIRINHRFPGEAPPRTVWGTAPLDLLSSGEGREERWFDCNDGKLDEAFESARKRVVELGVPFFEGLNTVEDILDAYDEEFTPEQWALVGSKKKVSPIQYMFSGAERERAHKLGLCNYLVGRNTLAREQLRTFLRDREFHSRGVHRHRREMATEAQALLEEIRKPSEEVMASWEPAAEGESHFLPLEYPLEDVRGHLDEPPLQALVEKAIESEVHWVAGALRWLQDGLDPTEQMRSLAENSKILKRTSQLLRAKLIKLLAKSR